MEHNYFIGLDGGGTKCRARLCNIEGQTLGEGIAGSANICLGIENAYASIMEATDKALTVARLDRRVLASTVAGMGLAGVVSATLGKKVREFPSPFANVAVESDAYVACLGAHAGEDGGIIILGTGSCGVALSDGEFRSVGGWGFPIADHGSGAWIGLELVRYALQTHDGMAKSTALSDALLLSFQRSPAEIVKWKESAAPRDYAAFVPLVASYAEINDELAEALLQRAAADVAKIAEVLKKSGADRLCLMGGISHLIAPRLPPELRGLLVPAWGDALDGALILARNLCQSE